MRKILRSTFGRLFNKNYLLMAATVCGISLAAASCSSNDDNPATPDLNLSEKIIGKWVPVDADGQPLLTNVKNVTTFLSATKATVSTSRSEYTSEAVRWNVYREYAVEIDGGKVILISMVNDFVKLVEEYDISYISSTEMRCDYKHTTFVNGNPVTVAVENGVRFVKTTADYTAEILGLWECTGLTGIETYNDANARLEFLSDGTYRYYRKDDAGQWQAVTTRDFQDYFVDGTLLATRWKNQGEEELREWWEIESLSSNEMVWTALRQNADGTTVQQKMTWKKIDLKLSEKIIGKWISEEFDGHPAPTNFKTIYTFVSTTKADVSTSFTMLPETGTYWNDKLETDVVINGNKITLTNRPNGHVTVVEELIVNDIDGSKFTANHKVKYTVDGNLIISNEDNVCFTKVANDYRDAIVGTWQGHCTSEGSVFDDGQEHRWQYNADGTYVYYVKDGDSWVPYATNTLNEYFVDGNLLCTRWIDNGVESREWWEITITDGKMNWTALRENEDGTTFTATFEMEKVE